MPTEIWLTVLLVAGFIIAAGAIMAVLAWAGVAVFRWIDRRRGTTEGREQSLAVADGLFELDPVEDSADATTDGASPDADDDLEPRP